MSVIKFRNSADEPWVEITTIQGPKGDKGDPGDTYTLTDDDYAAIADVVLTKLVAAEEGEY
jgi:hypothetical protein